MKVVSDIFIIILSNPIYSSILFMSIVTALLGLYVYSVTGSRGHHSDRREKKLS